ncbi:hypothetical protein CEXT_407191 [Caerostris extrusa]|uniref:Uncharacterized protein n=1 Tax=Caerostris extrusa TaxID=172846 RepID=A0AAV4UPT6_CAEEX|nr:hypothetical protein CEXT_407191 [Caerostris extrusa]
MPLYHLLQTSLMCRISDLVLQSKHNYGGLCNRLVMHMIGKGGNRIAIIRFSFLGFSAERDATFISFADFHYLSVSVFRVKRPRSQLTTSRNFGM